MKVLEVDKDLQARLFLDRPNGILIVDLGRHPEQLGMADARLGDCIWAVGDERSITTFDEFAQRLLALCDDNQRKDPARFIGGITSWTTHVSVWGDYGEIKLSADALAKMRHVVQSRGQ